MEVKDTWASQEDSSSGTPTALVDSFENTTLLKSLEVEELKKTDTLFEESVEMNELKQSDTLLQESFDAAATNIIEPSKPRMGTVKQVKQPVKSIFKKVVPIFILA